MASGTIPFDAATQCQAAPFTYSIPNGNTATFNVPSGGQWFMTDQVTFDIMIFRTTSNGTVNKGWVSGNAHSNVTSSTNTLTFVNNLGTNWRLYFFPLNGHNINLISDVVTPA